MQLNKRMPYCCEITQSVDVFVALTWGEAKYFLCVSSEEPTTRLDPNLMSSLAIRAPSVDRFLIGIRVSRCAFIREPQLCVWALSVASLTASLTSKWVAEKLGQNVEVSVSQWDDDMPASFWGRSQSSRLSSATRRKYHIPLVIWNVFYVTVNDSYTHACMLTDTHKKTITGASTIIFQIRTCVNGAHTINS